MQSDYINLQGALPERLVELMGLGTHAHQPWSDAELAAILQYQLARPLESDLGPLPKEVRQALQRVEPLANVEETTFGFWLHHMHPPLELLKLIKQFAKSSHANPLFAIPQKVAMALYYLSLAVALVRCKKRITSLRSEELKVGFDQLANALWMDPASRGILEEAWLSLTGKGDVGQNPTSWPENYQH